VKSDELPLGEFWLRKDRATMGVMLYSIGDLSLTSRRLFFVPDRSEKRIQATFAFDYPLDALQAVETRKPLLMKFQRLRFQASGVWREMEVPFASHWIEDIQKAKDGKLTPREPHMIGQVTKCQQCSEYFDRRDGVCPSCNTPVERISVNPF